MIGTALGFLFGLLIYHLLWARDANGKWFARDDTDSKDRRSGLCLFTDHGTGIQYLACSPFSGLTPRLGRDGRPLVSKLDAGPSE